MPQSTPLSPDEISELINSHLRNRLLTMLSQSLDSDAVLTQFQDDSDRRSRVAASLNWSRLLLGRMFLELLGMRKVLYQKGPRKDDVTITEIGGRQITEQDFTTQEWDCLRRFMMESDKIAHLTFAKKTIEVSKEVNDAIPLIVKAMDVCLYSVLTPPTINPVPVEYRIKHGL